MRLNFSTRSLHLLTNFSSPYASMSFLVAKPSSFSTSTSTYINVEKHIDDFAVEPSYLQPLGIIVNEILTNIMKYAFEGRAEGRIVVIASRDGDRARIEIGDDGVGMPDSIVLGKSTGFGLMLIENLTKQINGTVRIVRKAGTRFILEFPV